MNTSNTIQWLVAVVPLLVVAIGALLTYVFTARASRDAAIARFKEDKYAKLLVLMQGFVGVTASPELKREFFAEQYQSWLYASDEVVLAINRMVEHVKGFGDDDGIRLTGEMARAMRLDLLKKTTLPYSAFSYTSVVSDRESIDD